ncbi:MAG: MlaD family protein [Desulfovibrionaceae bacterium]
MEIHARYIWVGLVTLVSILALIWYMLWITSAQEGRKQVFYDIYFSQNVAGLQEGSSVLLHGVPVGTVETIRFNPAKPEQVLVRIRVNSEAPVRTDSIATIEPQGITGLANIHITGGTKDALFLHSENPSDIPIIQSQASRFEEILSAVPNILVAVTSILEKVQRIVSDDNIHQINSILEDTAVTIKSLRDERHSILAFFEDTAKAFRSFNITNKKLSRYIDSNLTPLTQSLQATASQLPDTVKLVNTQILDLSSIITDTQKTITQAKIFFINLDRVMRQFQANPKQFFFGKAYPDYTKLDK